MPYVECSRDERDDCIEELKFEEEEQCSTSLWGLFLCLSLLKILDRCDFARDISGAGLSNVWCFSAMIERSKWLDVEAQRVRDASNLHRLGDRAVRQ